MSMIIRIITNLQGLIMDESICRRILKRELKKQGIFEQSDKREYSKLFFTGTGKDAKGQPVTIEFSVKFKDRADGIRIRYQGTAYSSAGSVVIEGSELVNCCADIESLAMNIADTKFSIDEEDQESEAHDAYQD